MIKMYFYTQDYENYGTPEEPYWKAKGGEDFILEAEEWTEEMIIKAYDLIELSDDFLIRSMIGNQVVGDQFLTDFEQMQLDNEGQIQFPAKRVTFEEFVEECV